MKNSPVSSFKEHPVTLVGKWAAGLAAAFVTMFLINTFVFMPTAGSALNDVLRPVFLPVFGILMMLSGLAGGVVGVFALLRGRERSWMVWAAIAPGAFALFFLVGEFLFPH